MNALDELRACSSIGVLRDHLHMVCSRYGDVRRLDILTAAHEGAQQAICFLRLDSEENERRLMKSLGVGRFGGELVLVIDLTVHEDFDPGPSSRWADFGDSSI